MKKTVRVFAPATVSNVCCGFDVLGFALEGPGDEVTLTLTHGNEVSIQSIEPTGIRLPMEAEKNTAGVAVISYLKALGVRQGVAIELKKKLPLGSGMGSSGASAVAAVAGINHLMGSPLKPEQLLFHAMEAERVACGSAHADNVAPALLGGFVLIRHYDPLDIVQVPLAVKLWCVLVHPHIEVRTEDARKVLKPQVPLADTIIQTGNIAGLMVGLMKPDIALISRSLEDVIAEPLRKSFIPGFDTIKSEAIASGALGCGISGSGPTVFALCGHKEVAERVGAVMQRIFSGLRVKSEIYVSPIPGDGARVMA